MNFCLHQSVNDIYVENNYHDQITIKTQNRNIGISSV